MEHLQKDCFSPRGPKHDPKHWKGKKRKKQEKDDSAQKVHTVEVLNMAFVTTDQDVFMGDANVNELSTYQWIADTGATTHVTSNQDALTNYVSAQEEVLGLSALPVLMIGYGDLQLKTNAAGQNYKVLLNQVLHVPAIRHNILSIGRLDKAGSQVITGNGCIKLLDCQGRLFAEE